MFQFIRASILAILPVLIGYSTTNAQKIELEGGKRYDNLKIEATPNETYALYLPKNYSADKVWPIVYIFDPAARGIIGLNAFVDAAKQFDYILVCSNNSKNGILDANFKIASSLFFETLKNLAIDESRIYAAGFSGGARLSIALAMQNPVIRGVIQCGAGFSAQRPFEQTGFFHIGIVGDLDMNYLEMKKVEHWMEEINSNSHLIFFEGIHRWPPKESILKSFQWIEFNIMEAGEKQRDDQLILETYKKSYLEAVQLQTDNRLHEYADLTKRIIKRFESLIDVNSLKAQMAVLESDKKYQKGLSDLIELEDSETELSSHLIGLLRDQVQSPVDTFLAVWKKEFLVVDKRANSKEIFESKSGQRVIGPVRAWCIETGEFASTIGNETVAVLLSFNGYYYNT